jgi:hypothetical protein
MPLFWRYVPHTWGCVQDHLSREEKSIDSVTRSENGLNPDYQGYLRIQISR